MAQNNPFSSDINFEYGIATALSPIVRRFVADNPGPLTFKGTNVYVLGYGDVAIVDPGPDCEKHVQSLLKALSGERITRIFLTHTHKDHCGALPRLRALTGATTYAFSAPNAIRGAFHPPIESQFSKEQKPLKPGELAVSFADISFKPDRVLSHGDEVRGEDWTLRVVHTPGHAPDHVCYALLQEKALFTGDHIMPWSTSVIAPPEGSMSDYMNSLHELSKRDDELYLPGHGGQVAKPKRLLRSYVLHRQWREKSIFEAVQNGKSKVSEIVLLIYRDLDEELKPAAALSVLAHLLYLAQKGRIEQTDGEGFDARFYSVNSTEKT
ncbi:MAG: MBL fold metallo-hydrolase [Hyphomicrobiaceae bacterium]|nr:MBL fold metallo-hydrolase [Hyphomicrobiaceae bacterium]